MRRLFSQIGEVQSCRLIRDRESKRSRGFTFVEISSESAARQAILPLNGHQWGGQILAASEAREKREEQPGIGGEDLRTQNLPVGPVSRTGGPPGKNVEQTSKNFEPPDNQGSSIMAKAVMITDRFRVYQQVVRLQHAGKTALEIAESLGLTPAVVQHMISSNLPVGLLNDQKSGLNEKQRLELAYQLRLVGKSMAEISDRLQVNIPQVRRMIHRHGWILRHSK